MNDGIITRLQDLAFRLHPDSDVGSSLCDAADEIWELRNRIAQLEQALDALGYLKAITAIMEQPK
jgi:hypothetical protein